MTDSCSDATVFGVSGLLSGSLAGFSVTFLSSFLFSSTGFGTDSDGFFGSILVVVTALLGFSSGFLVGSTFSVDVVFAGSTFSVDA